MTIVIRLRGIAKIRLSPSEKMRRGNEHEIVELERFWVLEIVGDEAHPGSPRRFMRSKMREETFRKLILQKAQSKERLGNIGSEKDEVEDEGRRNLK